ncbi:response regulator transcription factor [Streptomyces sp. NRRL B-3648]|uniref:response regulator transcription factor n=1 Tax=Streptomyces sp. NRRL B-3648 TaxID=1519493 RepID=UPI000AF2CCEC|nr:response regulator transcription factor [Streptomyces sp. NRRL B-3648]
MTALVLEAPPEPGLGTGTLRVRLGPAGGAARDTVAAGLRRAGIELAAGPCDGAVRVAVGRTPGAALDGWPEPGGGPLLLVADAFTAAGVRQAVRAGAVAMLQSAEATPERLLTAVHAARYGEGRMSYDVLVRLLDRAGSAAGHPRPGRDSPLTARQRTVLALVAEGHGNAAIARELSCSQHTVKNVMYDLMTRLHVRNRAHAVAYGVRTGLI